MTENHAMWITALGLLATAFTATVAESLREFSRHELENYCRRRSSDKLGSILRWHAPVATACEGFCAVSTALFVCGLTIWIILRNATGGASEVLTIITSAALAASVLVVVRSWLPRALANIWAAPILFHTWELCRLLERIGLLFVFGERVVNAVLHRLAGRKVEEPSVDSLEDEIRTIVTEGHREGLLEEDAREMIEGVIELGDASVSEIMTPRTEMVCMPADLPWHDTLQFVIEAGHSRIPVYRENRDDIIGILYVKDLLMEFAEGRGAQGRPLAEIVRKPQFVPETKPIDQLLQDFQRVRHHLAIVLDEYGGVSGLVTIEDVLEEIVGEIVDEYDSELVEGILALDDRTAEVLGKVHIDEINERLGLELNDDGDFDTIAGYVFSELGRIPSVGEQLVVDTIRLTVLEATPRRIQRVRIEVVDAGEVERETAS